MGKTFRYCHLCESSLKASCGCIFVPHSMSLSLNKKKRWELWDDLYSKSTLSVPKIKVKERDRLDGMTHGYDFPQYYIRSRRYHTKLRNKFPKAFPKRRPKFLIRPQSRYVVTSKGDIEELDAMLDMELMYRKNYMKRWKQMYSSVSKTEDEDEEKVKVKAKRRVKSYEILEREKCVVYLCENPHLRPDQIQRSFVHYNGGSYTGYIYGGSGDYMGIGPSFKGFYDKARLNATIINPRLPEKTGRYQSCQLSHKKLRAIADSYELPKNTDMSINMRIEYSKQNTRRKFKHRDLKRKRKVKHDLHKLYDDLDKWV